MASKRRPKLKLTAKQSRQLAAAWQHALELERWFEQEVDMQDVATLRNQPEWRRYLAVGAKQCDPKTKPRGGGRRKPWWYEDVRAELPKRQAARPGLTYHAATHSIAARLGVPDKRVRYHTSDLRW